MRQPYDRRPRPDDTELRRQYGKVGISAVAAAMRYCGDEKKLDQPPSKTDRRSERSDKTAAKRTA